MACDSDKCLPEPEHSPDMQNRMNGLQEVSVVCPKEGIGAHGGDPGAEPNGPASGRHDLHTNVFLLALGLVSLVVVKAVMTYSRHTTHFRPLSNGQVLCLLLAVFLSGMWVFLHLIALCTAVRNFFLTRDHSSSVFSGVAWRRPMLRYITEDHLHTLTSAVELCGILLVYFICDRTDLLGRADKHYSRDTYWFIWIAIVGASLATIRRDAPDNVHVKLLQRDQTEEWKGWMQIQFLMYHYFHATEYYSAIRCYIAAYVWMTGFGNFSYYYIKKDFGLTRFLAMQWRLNFFALWCCLALENEYMLYYICMLHTTFTVFIYAGLGICVEANYSNLGIRTKFLLLLAASLIIWDIPGVFDMVWAPLRFLIEHKGSLHEWSFRSTLDHLVWIAGMLTAFNHPKSDALLESLDQMPAKKQYTIKTIVVALSLVGVYYWYTTFFVLPKKEYNSIHPFTSFIPITLYIILRNIFATLRRYHIEMFAWLGKITLETYISQFHVWLCTTGPNTNPKKLLRILPEGYPLMNFALVSCFYIYFSLRVFRITGTLKNFAIPSKDGSRLRRNLLAILVLAPSLYALSLTLNMTAEMGF